MNVRFLRGINLLSVSMWWGSRVRLGFTFGWRQGRLHWMCRWVRHKWWTWNSSQWVISMSLTWTWLCSRPMRYWIGWRRIGCLGLVILWSPCSSLKPEWLTTIPFSMTHLTQGMRSLINEPIDYKYIWISPISHFNYPLPSSSATSMNCLQLKSSTTLTVCSIPRSTPSPTTINSQRSGYFSQHIDGFFILDCWGGEVPPNPRQHWSYQPLFRGEVGWPAGHLGHQIEGYFIF